MRREGSIVGSGEPARGLWGAWAEGRGFLAAVERLQDLELLLAERQRVAAPDLRLTHLKRVAAVEMRELLELARRLHDRVIQVAVAAKHLARALLAFGRRRILAERVVVEVV